MNNIATVVDVSAIGPRTPAEALTLHGRVALVTGAGRGIGLACAQALAACGARVVMAGRDLPALQAAAEAINLHHPGSHPAEAPAALAMAVDVADPQSVKTLFQQVFRLLKRLDILVANAGVMEDALIGMVTPDLVQRVYATNTHGLLYCAQYASRLMARHGGGSIVAMGSIVGQHGHAGQAVYAGSKAAVVGTVQSLAKELAPQQIRVNAVAPGFIDTDLTRALPEARRAQVRDSIRLGRAGTPQDVADVVLFLASPLSRYVTGQVIGVDGGMPI